MHPNPPLLSSAGANNKFAGIQANPCCNCFAVLFGLCVLEIVVKSRMIKVFAPMINPDIICTDIGWTVLSRYRQKLAKIFVGHLFASQQQVDVLYFILYDKSFDHRAPNRANPIGLSNITEASTARFLQKSVLCPIASHLSLPHTRITGFLGIGQ